MAFQDSTTWVLVFGLLICAAPFLPAAISKLRRRCLRDEISDRIGVKILSGERANRVLTGWKVEHQLRAIRDSLEKAANGALGDKEAMDVVAEANAELAPAFISLRASSRRFLEDLKDKEPAKKMAGFMARAINRAIASHG